LENWAKWARASGIEWPETIFSSQQAATSLRTSSNELWLLKSMTSSGGSGTIEITGTQFLDDANYLERKGRYIQKFVPGDSIGVTFLSSKFGTIVVGAAKSWDIDPRSHANKFAYRGSCGPIALSCEHVSHLQQFGDLACRESKLFGLWQADFILSNGKLFLLEINPRWSASMDLLDVALNLTLVDMHYASICSSLGKEIYERFSESCMYTIKAQPSSMLGKLIAYADKPLSVTSALSDYWWENRWESNFSRVPSVELKHYFADIPREGTEVAAGDPLLTILASAKCSDTVLETLRIAQSNSMLI
jgi:uncharacterized protein